jgi:hypothetical protein
MKKKKKYNPEKVFEKIRRENEIKTFGKILSLRPTKVHKSKKKYKRDKKVDIYED